MSLTMPTSTVLLLFCSLRFICVTKKDAALKTVDRFELGI